MAEHHGIPPGCCLLLDDTPDVILDAALSGIHTVNFAEFCPNIRNKKETEALYENLQKSAFVELILQEKRQKIQEKVQQMIVAVLAKSDKATPDTHTATGLNTLVSWSSIHSRLEYNPQQPTPEDNVRKLNPWHT